MENQEAKHQLIEAFGHAARAFFDSADYIWLKINEVLNEKESNCCSAQLKFKIQKSSSEIMNLRKAKSENIENTYKNIINWDLGLQIITSGYRFIGLSNTIEKDYDYLCEIIDKIEQKHDAETIKNHDPDFFKMKLDINVIKELPEQYINYINDDLFFTREVLENIQKWQDDIVNEFIAKSKMLEHYKEHLNCLNRCMETSTTIKHIKKTKDNTFKIITGVISVIISFIITSCLNNYLMVDLVTASADHSRSKINTIFLIFFLIILAAISIALYFIIIGAKMLWLKLFRR
ncbi:MAG TPA: hypothetical protein PLZ84_02305 [Clostridia bacterium]|nr:hypothetical protein [Clostridia bacterium]